MPASTTEHRYTITITPMSAADLQLVIDDIRKRFGRKHLIHVIGEQPAGTGLMDAPGWDEDERRAAVERDGALAD